MSFKHKSIVWEYFKKTGESVKCVICKRSIATKGNTSNLHAHLKSRHPLQYSMCQKRKSVELEESTEDDDNETDNNLSSPAGASAVNIEPEIEMLEEESSQNVEMSLPSTSYASSKNIQSSSTHSEFSHFKQQSMASYTLKSGQTNKIHKALAYFIAVDMMPYSIVEKKGFKHLIKTIQPSYTPPSRKILSEVTIPNLFNEVKDIIHSQLQKAQFLTFTTDAWTSVANKSYISLTAHFVVDWALKSVCLNCKQVNDDHTSENLADILKSFFDEWEISLDKVVSFTTDAGSNIVKCVKLIKKQNLNCFGHTLNSGVNKAFQLEDIQRILNKVKKIQSLHAHSWKVTRNLRSYQTKLNYPEKKIPSYSRTRWWSLLNVIEVVVEQNVPITSLLSEYDKGKYKEFILTVDEVDILKSIIVILRPLKQISEVMAGEKYVTASAILPVCDEIKIKLRSLEVHDETQIDPSVNVTKVHFLQTIINYLNDRYIKNKDANVWLQKCKFLDPRFKTKNFDEEQISTIKTLILEEMQNVNLPQAENSPVAKKHKFGLSTILNWDQEESTACNDDTELKKYLNYTNADLDSDPLIWWKDNQSNFPKLSVLSKKFLCVQATSVASERVFSRGGSIVTDNRASLTSEHSEQLIFLALNHEYVLK